MGKIIAIIGAGGKTTSLCTLAQSRSEKRVLLTTTTHIGAAEPQGVRELLQNPKEEELLAALDKPGVVCAGEATENGKLKSLSPELLKKAAERADLTVCEADGANRHPMKIHREWEPVMPEHTDICLIVSGLSALGQPVSQVIHRYEMKKEWEENPETPVAAEELLFCIRENIKVCGLPREKIRILFNQADALSEQAAAMAEAAAKTLEEEGYSCRIGSMGKEPAELVRWILE